MRKRVQGLSCLFIYMMLNLSACLEAPAPEDTVLKAIGPENELSITPSEIQTADFAAKNTDFVRTYDKDECFNITQNHLLCMMMKFIALVRVLEGTALQVWLLQT